MDRLFLQHEGRLCFWFCFCVCACICQQDYCKSNQLISLKIDVMTGPSNGKNRLTFGGDPVTDKTRIPDHFFYLNIFISIGIEGKGILGNLLAFPTHSPAAFHKTRRNDCRQQGINPLPFGSDPVDARGSGSIRISDSNPGPLLFEETKGVRALGVGGDVRSVTAV